MASIEAYQTKAGRRFMVRYRNPHRRQVMKKGFRTKRDAANFAATVETSKLGGTYVDPTAGRITVGELGREWLDSMTHVRESSRLAYDTALRVHVSPAFGSRQVATVTTSDVRRWVATMSKTCGARTVRRAHYVLQAILETAAQDRRITRNPARGIKNLPPLPRQRRVYLDYPDVEALAEAAGEYGTTVRVAAYCGLRWGEIAALETQDIDLTGRRIHVRRTVSGKGFDLPKNGQERSVAYPEFLHADLSRAVLAADGLVFPQARPKNFENWWETTRRKVGLDITFHSLRHTYASLSISAGANVKVLQNALGHSSAVQTLDTYSDLLDQDVDDVAARISEARQRALA